MVSLAARRALRGLRCARLGVDIAAISPAESARLNRRFRGKRGPGDVLTFGAPPASAGGQVGEILLCLPLIRHGAVRRRRPFRSWLAELTVHGVLHAVGYHHDSPGAAAEMFSAQRALLRSR